MKKRQLASCPKCKEAILPHRACASCGTYAGRQVLAMKEPAAKKKEQPKSEE